MKRLIPVYREFEFWMSLLRTACAVIVVIVLLANC